MSTDSRCCLHTRGCCRLEETTKAVDEIRDKIDQQNTQLCDFEAEINMLKRRIESLTYDKDKDKKQIAQLQDALNRARIVSIAPVFHHSSSQYTRCPENVAEYLFSVRQSL